MRIVLSALLLIALCGCASSAHASEADDGLTVMAWNIWRGGREDGEEVGPRRVIDVIRDSGADLVAMQETYGSGELIAEALGFHFQPRGTNVSIHSRYPIVEDISVFEEFKCVGALIELPEGQRIAFYSIWLPYSGEIWAEGTRDTSNVEQMLAACEASRVDLTMMHAAIEERLSAEQYAGVPVIIAGDFNSMSHLDYGEIGWDQYGAVVDWPTSHILTRAGFVDTYRVAHPKIDREADATWTPRFPEQEKDRIDFIYARAPGWRVESSRVIQSHAEQFPSDHAAVVTQLVPEMRIALADEMVRAVSYNIKHGRGMDNVVALERAVDVLHALDADVIGLQEVDLGVRRSDGANQANVLAEQLGMHPAFGTFMDYQGGRYGMAVLSKHPIVDVEALRLPNGNEPRVALIVEVRLPRGETMLVVNVHFDWVDDDGYRFAQASALAEYLRGRNEPFVLLGDFNDQPGSRTINLFRDIATEVSKPGEARLTFPSVVPEIEIDFIWCAPKERWAFEPARVIPEPVASDHRPVVAELQLKPRD